MLNVPELGVASPPDRAEKELAELERSLRIIGYRTRLQLLSQLRVPRTMDELRLKPGIAREDLSPLRPIARQSVQAHLQTLLDEQLVRSRETKRKGKRAVHEYIADHARLFAITEALRQTVALRPVELLEPLATVHLSEPHPVSWPEGPKVVLVHGLDEGKCFHLKASRPDELHWLIGRTAKCHVRLEYDPFVSHEHAEFVQDDRGAFQLVDLRSARNGTFLNWKRLPLGGKAPLSSGDVIRVGRSLLVFRIE